MGELTDRSELTKPFFRRSKTIDHVGAIAACDNVAFYAGAGVTIDKSGLDWIRLVDMLLRQHVENKEARDNFIHDFGPLYAASAAHQYFRDAIDDPGDDERDVRQRMSDVLRVGLYAPAGWGHGQLAASVAEAAIVWNLRRRSTERDEQPCIVTTNYDDYLYGELLSVHQREWKRSRKRSSRPTIVFPTDKDPLVREDAHLAKWISTGSPIQAGVACLHLHGRIPRNAFRVGSSNTRFPVISESDYLLTAPHSEAALDALLGRRNLVIVGASLNDPPLVKALERSRDSALANGIRRWALITTSQMNSTLADFARRADYEELVENRLQSLGVTPIFVDYYMQLAQFFRELTVARQMSNPSRYGRTPNPHDYYERIDDWWRSGLGSKGRSALARKQKRDHIILRKHVLPAIREILDVPDDEALKLETWIRWDPKSTRTLRLWSSSSGIWTNAAAMRAVDIARNPEYLVVDAFRRGQSLSRSTQSDSAFSRWQSYLLAPFWLEMDDQKFLAGVALLASGQKLADASFGRGSRRRRIASCVMLLQDAGAYIASS